MPAKPPRPQDEKELLTTAEAARLLRCAVQTLRARRMRGAGPPFVKWSGNRVLYRRSALEAFLDDREYESTADESAAAALRAVSIG